MKRVLSGASLLSLWTAAWVMFTTFGFLDAGEVQEEKPSPIRIKFETPNPPKPDQAVEVVLWVEREPDQWPLDAGMQGLLEILLRLPMGVKLEDRGWRWRPVPIPSEEKEESLRVWSLWEWAQQVSVEPKAPSRTLARVPILLRVVEEGTNWVMTARVRLMEGEKGWEESSRRWQAFGTLFATMQGEETAFHPHPKRPLFPETDTRTAPSGEMGTWGQSPSGTQVKEDAQADRP